MREKILMISNVTGGLVNFRQELMEKLVKDYDVIVLAEENFGRNIIDSLGCTFINISIERHGTNPLKELELIKSYRKYIKEINPTVVLTYTIKPNIYAGAVCARLGVPYISNITGLGDAIENPGVLSTIARSLYKYGLRKACKVFFQNKANCDFFLFHELYSGDYEILPGSGVNLDKHPFEPYPKDNSQIVLSVVGRVTKDKGINEVLEASKQFIGLPLIIRIIGNCEDDYLDRIKEIEEYGVIEYVGRQENIHEWYKNSHAVLHASYHEGMSNVLLEAAASGRPILATSIPGCAEAFDEGISGFGFEPKSPSAIVQTIKKFLALSNEEKADMGKRGREKAEKTFNRDVVVNKYINAINSIGGKMK